jgi:hypothetical protein
MNKILLSTAAAVVVLGASSITSSANIQLSIGGEANLTALMDDKCFTEATATNIEGIIERVGATTIDTDDRKANDYITSLGHADLDFVKLDADAHTNGTTDGNPDGDPDDIDKNIVADIGYAANPCGAETTTDRSGIDWGFDKKLSISASGTLANGLEVSFSDDFKLHDINAETGSFDLTLGGAFGSLQFKSGAPSAVDAAMVTGKKDLDVTGTNLGFHPTETAGSAGMGILWTAPSMGSLDLYLSWAPNSGGDGLDNAKFDNTFGFGAVMNASSITIGAGYESASANAGKGGECVALAANTYDVTNAEVSAYDVVNQIWKGDYCGDETLMYIGATMDAANMSFSAGYSNLDTDEADKTVMSIGASTTVGEYDVSVDYRNTVKDYAYGTIEDTQDVIAIGVSTSLGDGVGFGVNYSMNNASLAADTGANGDTSNYRAEAKLTVGF